MDVLVCGYESWQTERSARQRRHTTPGSGSRRAIGDPAAT